jgi:hypothetical protein
LCQDCHRQVTSKYLSSKFQVKKKRVTGDICEMN